MSSVLSKEKIVFMDIAGNSDMRYREIVTRWMPKTLTVMHDSERLSELESKLDINKHIVYTIVKHPFKRAVDVWRQHYSDVLNNGGNYFPVGEQFTKALGLIKQGDLHQVELGSGLQPGYIQQNLFLENESDCEVYFMKEETIEKDWKGFIKDLEDDHFLFLPNSTIDEITELSTIKTDKLTSNDDWKSYYDERTTELVLDMYQKDFELYEYDTKLV